MPTAQHPLNIISVLYLHITILYRYLTSYIYSETTKWKYPYLPARFRKSSLDLHLEHCIRSVALAFWRVNNKANVRNVNVAVLGARGTHPVVLSLLNPLSTYTHHYWWHNMPCSVSENTLDIVQGSFWNSTGIHWDTHRIGWAVAGGCAVLVCFICGFRVNFDFFKKNIKFQTTLISLVTIVQHCRYG